MNTAAEPYVQMVYPKRPCSGNRAAMSLLQKGVQGCWFPTHEGGRWRLDPIALVDNRVSDRETLRTPARHRTPPPTQYTPHCTPQPPLHTPRPPHDTPTASAGHTPRPLHDTPTASAGHTPRPLHDTPTASAGHTPRTESISVASGARPNADMNCASSASRFEGEAADGEEGAPLGRTRAASASKPSV